MAHTLRTRFTHLALAGALLGIHSLGQAHAHEEYTPAQQVAVVDALSGVLQKLDQLDQRLLPAYGASLPVIRMEELKRGDIAHTASAPAVQSAVERIHDSGATVIRRIASFEPLWGACALTHESIEVLDVLSRRTGELLEQRGAATPAELAQLAHEGGAEGLQRLHHAHELNCRPVRTALSGTLPALQDAYAPVTQVLAAKVGEVSSPAAAVAKATPPLLGHPVPAPPATPPNH